MPKDTGAMCKYDALWHYIGESGDAQMTLTFDEIHRIAGVPIDHSFLRCKRELTEYGWAVQKISMKAQTVHFAKTIRE